MYIGCHLFKIHKHGRGTFKQIFLKKLDKKNSFKRIMFFDVFSVLLDYHIYKLNLKHDWQRDFFLQSHFEQKC